MRGRGSTVISIRLPDDVVYTLTGRAKGLSVSEYIKQQIVKSCGEARSVNKVVNTTKLEIPGLKIEGNKIVGVQPKLDIPRYNPKVHKEGDRVLRFFNNKWVEVTVPEIDLDR